MSYSSIITATASAVATLCTQMCFAGAGYISTDLRVEHRDRAVPLHIYYPTRSDAAPVQLGKNAVFKGTEVLPDAPAKSGPHPIVVLSHGSGGNGMNLAWIAASLAEKGILVFAPNHPGTTSGDSFPTETVKVWERPMDLRAILDKIAAGEFAHLNPDITRIGVMGFSLGGYSALALGGAKAVKSKYVDYCNANAGKFDCGWFSRGNLDLTTIDREGYEQSHKEPRIKAVVAIDPAIAQAYDTPSLNAIEPPVMLINLGTGDALAPAIDARGIANAIPNAEYVSVRNAVHFSFLAECTKMGWAFIKAAGEDPICTDDNNRTRADIHEELKGRIAGFFLKELNK